MPGLLVFYFQIQFLITILINLTALGYTIRILIILVRASYRASYSLCNPHLRLYVSEKFLPRVRPMRDGRYGPEEWSR